MTALHSTTPRTQTTHVKPTSTSTPQARIQSLLGRRNGITQGMGCKSLPVIPIDTLRSLPATSFGRAWADFLDTRGLLSMPTEARCKQLLNGIHILTGYGTDPIGKAEVQAFLLGTRLRWVNQALAIAFLYPTVLNPIFLNIHRTEARASSLSSEALSQRLLDAYWRGRRSVLNLKTWRPEMLWDLPLGIVQQWFRV